jgi:uncharacterized MAPEG superfamily protein
MTIAYWCVLIMLLLPYVFTVLAKSGSGFNNCAPREYLEQLKGWRKRAHWVQLNNFEAFPAFAVSIIIAYQLHANTTIINRLAVTFVVARILYGICYLTDKASLRTLFWSIGLGCVIAIFIAAAYAS